ncbi:TonB-dependent siderophore receptor [[Actinobacillus] rossii]|uniref:TonB-dependent siderophore receptor n=1 Tax=[Actinobacillus] rossii TaxID=123820 RepID=A0A380TPP0_9PAST|nr:TonB-dependent siderophore receptor [[Actinobacillus] rossii]
MKRTLLCTAITLACSSVYAETFELGKIEVIAEKLDNNVAVADQTQLQQNQIINVAQVAKITSGVFFQRGGGRGEQNLMVRGFDSRRVPIFIDGIPVYVPYDGAMDLGRFTTFDLAEIDISKGASSVLYGANTMGGAVNLVTRKPSKDLEGNIGYGYQTGRSGHTAGNQTYFNLGSKQEQFYAQISGSWFEKQGMQLSRDFQPNSAGEEDGGRAENSVNRDKKLSLRLGYTPNATDEYALSYSMQRGQKQQPLYTGEGASKYWRWPAWDKNSLYFLSHTEFNKSRFYLNTKAFHDTFKNDLAAFDDDTFTTQMANSSFTSHYRDYSYGAGLEFGAKTSDKNTLKLSALYKADVHRENNDGDPVARSEDRNYSLGLEDTYNFTKQTRVIAGASFDRREAVQAQNYQAITSGNYGIYEFDIADKNAFNYQVKLAHNFDKNDELSVSYAHKTRFPTMKDRYSRSLSRNRLPNPFLKPEIADHYEIGYFRTFDDSFKVEGALFYSDVRDAISEIYTGNFTTTKNKKTGKTQTIYEVQNQNVGKAAYRGVELAITAFVNENLTLGANYTYLNAKNYDSELKLTDIPRHKFFAYADWKFTSDLSLYLAQSAESGRYSAVNGENKKLAGFGTTDAKLTYAINKDLIFDVGVSNIFDKNYYLSEGYAEEGRIYFTNLKYQF